MDCVGLLRSAVTSNRLDELVVEQSDSLFFRQTGQSYPKSTQTPLQRSMKNENYTLSQIYQFAKFVTKNATNVANYVMTVQNMDERIEMLDFQKLFAYLHSETDTFTGLTEATPYPNAKSQKESRKRKEMETIESNPSMGDDTIDRNRSETDHLSVMPPPVKRRKTKHDSIRSNNHSQHLEHASQLSDLSSVVSTAADNNTNANAAAAVDIQSQSQHNYPYNDIHNASQTTEQSQSHSQQYSNGTDAAAAIDASAVGVYDSLISQYMNDEISSTQQQSTVVTTPVTDTNDISSSVSTRATASAITDISDDTTNATDNAAISDMVSDAVSPKKHRRHRTNRRVSRSAVSVSSDAAGDGRSGGVSAGDGVSSLGDASLQPVSTSGGIGNVAAPSHLRNGMSAAADEKPFWRTLKAPRPDSDYLDCQIRRQHDESLVLGVDNRELDWGGDWRSRVREDGNRNTILLSTNENKKTFGYLLETMKVSHVIESRIRKIEKNPNASSVGIGKAAMFVATAADIERKQRVETPIIVVPLSHKTLINTDNAFEFFQNGNYKAANNEGTQNERIAITKKSKIDATKTAKFEVINSPTPNDWDRIVAVFALGRVWQFRQWDKEWRSPEVIFNKCAGFYAHYSYTEPTPPVSQWRVHKLPISVHKRHDDARVSRSFWEAFYKMLQHHKNHKLFY